MREPVRFITRGNGRKNGREGLARWAYQEYVGMMQTQVDRTIKKMPSITT
jgi:hypothetical protein